MSEGFWPALRVRDAASVAVEVPARPATGVMRWCRQARFLAWLALPFAFYLIPVLLGFSWNALGEGHNILNPPEGYQGRLPDRRITVESWGAGVVDVPFHARLHTYLKNLQLPLWNPYQGLGQPFAAQGEENPYSPFAVVRAVLPYSRGNVVTFAVYYMSSVFFYLFLRELGVSERAAIFGGATFAVSGALSLQIGRPNIADQVSLIPVLFWGAATAIRQRSTLAYAMFAVVAALHLIGGFIQIAMLSAVLLIVFCLVYTHYLAPSRRIWLRDAVTSIGVFGIGNGLVAFYLLPLLEAMVITFNKDLPYLALFVPIGLGNVVAFFFPLLFSYSFYQPWSPPPAVADWENLYAFAGTALLLIAVFGAAAARWASGLQRRMYWLFVLAAVFLIVRYVGAPPAELMNYLPILGRQSPKHATGVMVFCCVVAAAFAVQAIGSWKYARGKWFALAVCFYLASVVAKLVEGAGYTSTLQVTIDRSIASRSFFATGYLAALVVGALWLCSRWKRLSAEAATTLLTAVAVAELLVYIPLGNGAFEFLVARLALSTLVVACGVLVACRRTWTAAGLFAATLGGYALLIQIPSVGLPRQFNVDGPPRFLTWLEQTEGTSYRSFGIAPDHSSIGAVQDISVVGPLAPKEFAEFVRLVSDQKTANDYAATTHFMLAGPWSFSLDQYQRVKPIFDWIGVRYLVLDNVYFNPREPGRTDEQALLSGDSGVRLAYQDDRVRILESPAAQPKAEFWTGAAVYPDQGAILAELKKRPDAILGPPKVEASAVRQYRLGQAGEAAGPLPARVEQYRPNDARVSLDAPGAGVLVLKDSYFPGWRATLNGSPADVLRVDGLVRGVVIPAPGHYDVQFLYRPDSFVRGLWVSGCIAVVLLVSVANAVARKRREPPWWALLAGGLLLLVLLDLSSQAYFGSSVLSRVSRLSPLAAEAVRTAERLPVGGLSEPSVGSLP